MKHNLSNFPKAERRKWRAFYFDALHWHASIKKELQQLHKQFLAHEFMFDAYTQDMIAEFISQQILGVEK